MPRTLSAWFAAAFVAYVVGYAITLLYQDSHPAPGTPVPLAALPTWALCGQFNAGHSQDAMAELRKRHEWNVSDYDAVAAGRLAIGMARDAVVCVRGLPDRTSTTETAHGYTEWMAWDSPRLLVRVDNYNVASITD